MFFTILTEIGEAKRAAAEAGGSLVQITEIAVGDGNGAEVTPVDTMTSLVNEVWREDVDLVQVHPDNPNWVSVEGRIPVDEGGFWIREVGLFDGVGDLIAIANYPATEKTVLTSGAGQDLYLRLVLAVSNTATIELTVDPDIVMASRLYVDTITAALQTGIIEAKRRAFFFNNTL